MKKVVIIGGGASGLVAAIHSKNNDNEVIVLERNQNCGKKLLATGNGRCNYFNSDQDVSHYYSSNKELIPSFISAENCNKVLEFFDLLGIVPKIKNGYYYPFSNQAITIRNALVSACIRRKIIIKNDFLVNEVKKVNDKFVICSNDATVEADILIIAAGSKAYSKTGSDGMGYRFLKQFYHKIIKPLPALVQLQTKGNYLKKWSGIRTEVILSLYENDQFIRKELGEIQLTNYGISGICTFNLSGLVARGLDGCKREVIKINFLPFLPFHCLGDYIDWFDQHSVKTGTDTILEELELLLNYKLAEVILDEAGVDRNTSWARISFDQKRKLVKKLSCFSILITGVHSYDDAQVCSGGLSLQEVDLNTMESKLVKNLYITGELLDIVGDCGGYNLTIAWISGLLAGNAVGGEK